MSTSSPDQGEASPLLAPDTIVFQDVGDVSSATLVLRNEHASRSLFFKVRLTMPKSYRVRPNEGEISPGDSFPIPVTVTSKAPPVGQRTKDRFQIISLLADNKEDAAEKWKQYSDHKNDRKSSLPFPIYEQRLKCVFKGPLEGSPAVATSSERPVAAKKTGSSDNQTPPRYDEGEVRERKPTSSVYGSETPKQVAQAHVVSNRDVGAPHQVKQQESAGTGARKEMERQDDMLKLVAIFILGLILGKMFL